MYYFGITTKEQAKRRLTHSMDCFAIIEQAPPLSVGTAQPATSRCLRPNLANFFGRHSGLIEESPDRWRHKLIGKGHSKKAKPR